MFVCLFIFFLGRKLNRQNCLLKEVLREREENEEKEKKKGNCMLVFPKQICKRFLPDAGESRSDKTFFLKTNMELEVCTSLGSMFNRRGALFVNEIRPANDVG